MREAGGLGTEGYQNSPIRVGCTRPTGDGHGRTAADSAQRPGPIGLWVADRNYANFREFLFRNSLERRVG
jgi:hypothetical protein